MSELEPEQWVAIADGDDVGRVLDALAAANDEQGLLEASQGVDADRERIATWFQECGAVVLLSVADTVIATGRGSGPERATYPVSEPTWSIGLGSSLRGAHAALAVAKKDGKNRWIDARTWDV